MEDGEAKEEGQDHSEHEDHEDHSEHTEITDEELALIFFSADMDGDNKLDYYEM